MHPLLSTALSLSSTTYNASKTYIRPFRYVAESAESITAPVVRRTGLEGYIRRGLENKRRRAEDGAAPPRAPTGEREQRWQTRLYYSSTGLATALSDESRRSLKYCLKILFSANTNLTKVIETLSGVVDELDQYLQQKSAEAERARPSSSRASSGDPAAEVQAADAGLFSESCEQRRQRLSETVDRLKDEALQTLKQVVDTVSRYAGGALPEQARNAVKRQLLSFPLRWQASTNDVERGAALPPASQSAASRDSDASSRDDDDDDGDDDDVGGRSTKGKAVRVLVMAREGLDMLRGVAEVVNGTLLSAEQWCDKLSRRRPDGHDAGETAEGAGCEEKGRKRVGWVGGNPRVVSGRNTGFDEMDVDEGKPVPASS